VDMVKIGDIATFDVFLDSDSGGTPGSVIEQIGFGLSATASFPASLITANTIGTPITLTAGTPYWLVVSPHQADSRVTWAGGGSVETPRAISLDGGNTWPLVGTDALEFQIDGTPNAPVPEPSTYGLLGGIAAFLFGLRRGRERA